MRHGLAHGHLSWRLDLGWYNRLMPISRRFARFSLKSVKWLLLPKYSPGILLVILLLISSACAPVPPVTPIPTETPLPLDLTPYVQIPSPSPRMATPTPTPQPTPTLVPTPTATPFLYKIVEGDTLGAIAGRYGVTLDELLTANPGVDPRLLTIGKELVIPLRGTGQVDAPISGLPTPAPVLIQAELLRCWAEMQTHGTICLLPASNLTDMGLEDVAAQVTLYDGDGKVVGTGTAALPIQLLPQGEKALLVLRFSETIPEVHYGVAQVTRALQVNPGDLRYLPIEVDEGTIHLSENGLQARVSGKLVFDPVESVNVRVLVIGLDAFGAVVGYRVWEASPTSDTPVPLEFAVQVYGFEPIVTMDWIAQAALP